MGVDQTPDTDLARAIVPVCGGVVRQEQKPQSHRKMSAENSQEQEFP
jgi:hypothetical protein